MKLIKPSDENVIASLEVSIDLLLKHFGYEDSIDYASIKWGDDVKPDSLCCSECHQTFTNGIGVKVRDTGYHHDCWKTIGSPPFEFFFKVK